MKTTHRKHEVEENYQGCKKVKERNDKPHGDFKITEIENSGKSRCYQYWLSNF